MLLIIVTHKLDFAGSDVARGLFVDQEWVVGERLAEAFFTDLGPGRAGESVG